MIDSFDDKRNMLHKLDPRAGYISLYQQTRITDEEEYNENLEFELCDQQEISSTFHYE